MGKSSTCTGNNGPLSEFDSEADALYCIEEMRINNLVPYKCQKCKKWHLSPKNRQTPSTKCNSCHKDLYSTKAIALRRAEIIREEKGVRLSVYKCSYMEGWHLTSKDT